MYYVTVRAYIVISKFYIYLYPSLYSNLSLINDWKSLFTLRYSNGTKLSIVAPSFSSFSYKVLAQPSTLTMSKV